MLICKENSCLLLIDVQENLAPLVLNKEGCVENCHWLLSLANDLDVPICVTEQYPQGLGATLALLNPLLEKAQIKDKLFFSMGQDEKCMDMLESFKKKQVIVMGMETAVCVLQSVLELREKQFDVFVVVDAVSGRHELDAKLALARMEQAGAVLVSKEMVFFEWLRTAGADNFKQLSQIYLQGK